MGYNRAGQKGVYNKAGAVEKGVYNKAGEKGVYNKAW